jgi:nicotinamide-nucleotide amidase
MILRRQFTLPSLQAALNICVTRNSNFSYAGIHPIACLHFSSPPSISLRRLMITNLDSIARYLEENNLKLVTAESCTAGMVASTLAEIPGCGSWLDCAFVTYSVNAKITCLGVKQETIDRYNLTSEEVAREMALGALRVSRANVAIADTGLAGPSNGDSDIPVGTICFAWAFEHDGGVSVFSETRKFNGDRNEVREAGTNYVIDRIWHYHSALEQQRAGAAAQS